MSKDSNRAVVFVTGSAAGIGQELAHLLAKHRSQLISVDQNAEGLRRFADHLRAQYGVPVTLITQALAQMGGRSGHVPGRASRGLARRCFGKRRRFWRVGHVLQFQY